MKQPIDHPPVCQLTQFLIMLVGGISCLLYMHPWYMSNPKVPPEYYTMCITGYMPYSKQVNGRRIEGTSGKLVRGSQKQKKCILHGMKYSNNQ